VLATQNPIEQEGTFPLPEAQLDRFMLLIKVSYPTAGDERAMLDRMSSLDTPVATEVASIEQVRMARRVVGSIYIDDRVRDYSVHVVQATRRPRDYGLAELAQLIEIAPRRARPLSRLGAGCAFIRHRAYVRPTTSRRSRRTCCGIALMSHKRKPRGGPGHHPADLRAPPGRDGADQTELFKKARRSDRGPPARRRQPGAYHSVFTTHRSSRTRRTTG
jgi:hypothetical protein